jgi:hypothetical protein
LNFGAPGNASKLEHEALADMLYETHQYDDSVKEYRIDLAGDPDNTELRFYVFFVLREKDDWGGAVSEDMELSSRLLSKLPTQFGDVLKKSLSKKMNVPFN